jgi:CubicO group peptidase (beta-lactamase class C family)
VTLRLVILLALFGVGAGLSQAETADDTALATFIERERIREGVPGVAVSVIRNHAIVWSRGFGIANTLTRAPVTPTTAFASASNAKPLAAWLVVQRAARGVIDLRKPALQQAAVNLPDTPRHRRITPLHLLTHTSGLGNFLRDTSRDIAFEPGERFAYSGVGFMVLQELLEAKTSRSLEAEARAQLFDKLALKHTWYGARPPTVVDIAAPHVSLAYAIIPLTVIGVPTLAVVMVVSLIGIRLLRGAWRSRAAFYAGLVAAPIAAAATFLYLSGSPTMTAWFIAVPLAVAAPPLIAARLLRAGALSSFAMVLAYGLAVFIALRDVNLPVPIDETPNAASSLHASAPDLARFLIELATPTLGDLAATREMTAAQHRIDDIAAWGLGIGVERHAKGRDLWQWGSNPGAKSLMIISPETGDGVVILSNGEVDGDFTRRIAARVLGRKGCWRAGCRE